MSKPHLDIHHDSDVNLSLQNFGSDPSSPMSPAGAFAMSPPSPSLSSRAHHHQLTPSPASSPQRLLGGGMKRSGSRGNLRMDEKDSEHPGAPQDSRGLIYALTFIMGIGVLLPWNAFITASDYFGRVFMTVTTFENYFSVAYLGSNCIGLAVLICTSLEELSATVKMISGLLVQTLGMAACLVIAILTKSPQSGSDEQLTLWLLVAAAVVCGLSTAVMESGAFGFSGWLPPRYTQGVMTGMGVAGTFVCLLRAVTKAAAADSSFESFRSTAILYFSIAVGGLLLCGLLFLLSLRHPLIIYHRKLAALDAAGSSADAGAHTPLLGDDMESPTSINTAKKHSNKEIMLKLKGPLFAVFFVFVVTLGLFPGVTVNISSARQDSLCWFPVVIFSAFNLGDTAGRIVSGRFPISMRSLVPSSLLRLLFGPAIIYIATSRLTLGGAHDVAAAAVVFCMGMSSGWVASSCMMHAPSLFESPTTKERVGTIMVFSLTIGLVCGAALSFPVTALLGAFGSDPCVSGS